MCEPNPSTSVRKSMQRTVVVVAAGHEHVLSTRVHVDARDLVLFVNQVAPNHTVTDSRVKHAQGAEVVAGKQGALVPGLSQGVVRDPGALVELGVRVDF